MRSSALDASRALSPQLILASASPRRRELLAHVCSSFGLASSQVEEVGSDLLPAWPLPAISLPPEYALPEGYHPVLWAWRKASDAAQAAETGSTPFYILAADTVVIAAGWLMNKPEGPEQAAEMLSALRGRDHYVTTGFVLVEGGTLQVAAAEATVTRVRMRSFGDAELEGYVASGEPLDKAGAYAVQGRGGALVEQVDGCYTNVVGLPLCRVRAALESANIQVQTFPTGGYCAACPARSNL